MPKKTKTDTSPPQSRSSLSDFTLDLPPGSILTHRSRDSLLRCVRVSNRLFHYLDRTFKGAELQVVRARIDENFFKNISIWYWHNHDIDHRTKGSDLKRELQNVVPHLDALVEAMKVMHPKSKQVLNRLLAPPTWEDPTSKDVIAQIEALNAQFLKYSRPLIRPLFTKEASISVEKACKMLIDVWERVTLKPFDYSYKIEKTPSRRIIVKEKFEFSKDSMRFVHVLMQAIDPKVTVSQVRTNVRRVAKRASETR